MFARSLAIAGVALSFAAFAAVAQAEDKAEDNTMHAGVVVSAAAGKLVMTGDDGKEHSHAISKDVKVTIDGKPGKLEDLKKGDKIKVTTDKDNKVLAVSSGDAVKLGTNPVVTFNAIADDKDAADKDNDLVHNETVVSAGEGKLVAEDADGKKHTHTVGDTAKITIKGKAAKLEDLKKGDKVKVTLDKDGKVLSIASGEATK